MAESNKLDWYLGLDIGTNSVGFSATDTDYNILTKNGKLQCGARLFEDAEDSSERRGFRSSRRRLARRKTRVDMLQELFGAEMTRKDETFFIRLNESNLHNEDRKVKDKYPLFNDSRFTDRDYYEKFPTIYHLRKYLLENDAEDVRLLYLACHHLIKYRGHFLFLRFGADSNSERDEILADLGKESFESLCENKAIDNALKGNKIDLKKIFPNDDEIGEKLNAIKDEIQNYKFSSEQFDECHKKVSEVLNEEQAEYIFKLKSLYDRKQLDDVLSGFKTISEAMVARYDAHKTDLKLLKEFIKKYLPAKLQKTVYNAIFRENGIYSNYVGRNNTHKKEIVSHCKICKTEATTINHEEFLEKINGIIAEAKDSYGYEEIKTKIDNKTFCKIHNTHDNYRFPHQLHEAELRAILEKQKNNFAFLRNEDEYGTTADKIVSLLTFRIPYYVGPLSEKDNGKFSWIVKNEGFEKRKITPWNFEKAVDAANSAEQFISRMTAKCTYLKREDVIPKQSLLYQKYMLLNDLNNLKINGNRIGQELKMFLFNGICQTEKSLSKVKIEECLVKNGKIQETDTVGNENENDVAFNSSLSSLIKFKNILSEAFDEAMCENIIKWHTAFGNEKEPVKQRIKSLYGGILTPDQIKELSSLSFNGWARFSERFLRGITATNKSTGETALTIIKLLEETTLNLMEILNSDNYSPKFNEAATNENKSDEKFESDYERLVKNLYCSPTVKRSIWQAILICKELTKINKRPPKKVFIEVTRGEDKTQKGKMKASRRKQVEELLNKAAKYGADIAKIKAEFDRRNDEKEFRSDKLYLYFIQLGKCMYSGEPIDIDNYDLFDIDHIYPQSKIKDDSLTNRVLVKRAENARKGNVYPIENSIQEKMKPYWQMLKEKGLINAEKYNRLTCTQPLSEEQIGGFINRQLVSTNQAVKETANALKFLFGDDKIVYSKAANVSEFRHTYDLIKCREINNLHHAHDAYLNIVVGNVWNSVYTKQWFSNANTSDDKLIARLFGKDHDGVWKTVFIKKIKAYLFDNKKYLGKFPVTFHPYEKKGAFYDQTIYPKGKAQFKRKEKKDLDINKYGGYKDGKTAYNCLVEYDKKQTKTEIKKGVAPRRIRGIFPVPARFVKRYDGEELLLKKIAEENKIADKTPKLLVSKIQMFSVLEINGIRYHMRSGDLQCSVTAEWYPDKEIIRIAHDIFKYTKLVSDKQITADRETMDDILFASREKDLRTKESKKISRENNLLLFDAIIKQIKKPFYVKIIQADKFSRDKFINLPTYGQKEALIKMLKFVSCGEVTVGDLEVIGGINSENAKWRTSNTLSENVVLITQSVTGLFEKRVVLNKKECNT
ncbi:MAG: type II CRISPR RNA-guided endonuclease Cas9 [Helicobacteraceae bacterium]|jgi:CRISPR-associated endonuclease Csn1|nr:type II CRISPR RNA-guided endonuclease Cas9 [Helicobacteraceae bacterium]